MNGDTNFQEFSVDVERLITHLRERDALSWADRVERALSGGSTSGEVLAEVEVVLTQLRQSNLAKRDPALGRGVKEMLVRMSIGLGRAPLDPRLIPAVVARRLGWMLGRRG